LTAQDSPKPNIKVERKFATLYGRVQAVINIDEFAWTLLHIVWAYSSLYATKQDNLLIWPDTHLTCYDIYHGTKSSYAKHLDSFREISVVKTTATMKEWSICEVLINEISHYYKLNPNQGVVVETYNGIGRNNSGDDKMMMIIVSSHVI
jgi:hypothetical protein